MMQDVAAVDLVDETFLVATPESLAAIIVDPRRHHQWWPDLRLTVFMDRGLQGQRWSMTGDLVGSLEIWLEPFADGCIVHYYLRGEPPGGPWPDTPKGWRTAAEHRAKWAKRWKRDIWALKSELEAGRGAGQWPSR